MIWQCGGRGWILGGCTGVGGHESHLQPAVEERRQAARAPPVEAGHRARGALHHAAGRGCHTPHHRHHGHRKGLISRHLLLPPPYPTPRMASASVLPVGLFLILFPQVADWHHDHERDPPPPSLPLPLSISCGALNLPKCSIYFTTPCDDWGEACTAC